MPYTSLPQDWDVPDAPRDRLLDSTDLDGITGRLNQVLRRSTPAYEPPDRATVELVVKNLRRTHLSLRSTQELARELEDSGNQLTREQERTLSLLRWQHRAQITGGAGSGKTHLAMLKARRLTRGGFRTALVCYSRGLARYFQLMSRTWPEAERPAYIGLFHQLPVEWGAEPGEDDHPDHWERRLPQRLRELAADRPEESRFDAIVVDQAQDFGELWWEALVQCFKDPDRGVLFVFADEHQRIFIALLTTGSRHPVQREIVETEGFGTYWEGHLAEEDVFYGHVLGFKGLERSAVVLAVNGFQDMARAQHMVYVGMSRARSLLVVVGPREVLEEAAGPDLLTALDAGKAWRPPAG